MFEIKGKTWREKDRTHACGTGELGVCMCLYTCPTKGNDIWIYILRYKTWLFLTLATVSVQKYHSAYQPAGHRRIISPLVEIVLNCAALWMDPRGELKRSEYSQLFLLETSKRPPALVLSLPPVGQHLASLSLTESLAHLLLIQGIGNPYLT